MDKNEYRIKTEQMLEYIGKKSYKNALLIADSIDWNKVKNAAVLCAASEVYEYSGEYHKSREILFIAYDRSPSSRKIVYRLGTLALKMGDIREATDCYEEFVAMAPKDPNQYILRYKILKTQKAPLTQQIEALEDFKKAEYVEKWAYELAKLYHEAGMVSECLEECDDLILWFSEGIYVYQAMELKMHYKPLTPLQQEKYIHRNDPAPVAEQETVEEADEAEEESVEENAEDAEEVTEEAEDVTEADAPAVSVVAPVERAFAEEELETVGETVAEEELEAVEAAVAEADIQAAGEAAVEADFEAAEETAAETDFEAGETVAAEEDASESEAQIAQETVAEEAGAVEAAIAEPEKVESVEEADAEPVNVKPVEETIADAAKAQPMEKAAAVSAAEPVKEVLKAAGEAAEEAAAEAVEKPLVESGVLKAAGEAVKAVTEAAGEAVEKVSAEAMKAPSVEEEIETEDEKTAGIDLSQTAKMSVEEILQNWEEKQKENAQLIQEEQEKAQLEKEKQEALKAEEEVDSILPDDIRQLMEELEAEAAEINTNKTRPVPTVEVTRAVEAEPEAEIAKQPEEMTEAEDAEEEEEEEFYGEDRFEEVESDSFEEIEESEETTTEVEETEGLKLGDTQSIAVLAKALMNDKEVETPIEKPIERTAPTSPFDTGFIVQGRYDLEAQSEIGLKAGLTEEQKKLFSYFVPVHGMSEQIVDVLENDRKCKTRYGTSRTANLLIVGRKGSGKTVLAVDIVKAIQKTRRLKQGKVGIVTAESLNKKDVSNIIEKLHGGAIIIERASKLNKKTIAQLNELMEEQTGELLVVLEEERRPLDKMLTANPAFKKKFTSRLELPVFINDELVTFAQTYAKENGYKIDEMGILALYSRIDMMQREENAVTVADVKEIMDSAIEHSQKMDVKRFMKKVLGKSKDQSDRIILQEQDFK